MNGGNQMTNKHIHSEATPLVDPNVKRRGFLGKGIKAAPFVITLASQPALGEICFTPSRALSKNTSISQQGKDGVCTGAESPGNYAAKQNPTTRGAYHWPSSPKPTDPLHPTFKEGNHEGVTKFTKTVNGNVVSQTFGEALNVNAPGQVHFHLIAAYLNVKGGNGAVISPKAITADGVLTMWQEYASRGYYEPVAGVKWYEKEIVEYLKLNGIVD